VSEITEESSEIMEESRIILELLMQSECTVWTVGEESFITARQKHGYRSDFNRGGFPGLDLLYRSYLHTVKMTELVYNSHPA